RREIAGGWVAIDGGFVTAVGRSTDPAPAAVRTIDAGGCLVTPGLVNTHHHLYQNLTRAHPPMTAAPLFGWLATLYPLWRGLDDDILAESEAQVQRHHDRGHGAMVRIALAPCSPFTVTTGLMTRTAELAERLDVRLHTHLAENAEDDAFSMATFGCRPVEYFERVGWCTDRSWVAHCVTPDADEVRRLGAAGVGVAHCPSSNLIVASGIDPA